MELKPSPDRLVVACGSDENYGVPLGVTLYSMVSNLPSGTGIDIYVLSLGISDSTKAKIRRALSRPDINLSLEIIEVDPGILDKMPECRHIKLAAYLRILLPTILPSNCEKVLYLDSDLLIREDITPLWLTDIGDQYVLAAPDGMIPSVSHEHGLYNWKELGMPADALCFNTGVLIINLARWRREDLSQKLFHYAAKHSSYLKWADQDVINALCFESWGLIPPQWNVIVRALPSIQAGEPSKFRDYFMSSFEGISNRPAIVHYASEWKPWNPRHSQLKFSKEWYRYLRKSGWFSLPDLFAWWSKLFVRDCGIVFQRRVMRRVVKV
jgi:lipopolysaccharide biosynthesis glycosyltransferase